MSNLYEKIFDRRFICESLYYRDMSVTFDLTEEECLKFIQYYFNRGGKGRIFEKHMVDFTGKGKYIHTVTMFLLGNYFKDILGKGCRLLTNYLNSNLYCKEAFDTWSKFEYTWFLCALFHDMANVIETIKLPLFSNNKFKGLETFLKEYNIQYNLHSYVGSNLSQENFIYSESIINKYFFYRMDYHGVADHGILGGYLFFDRLFKNYNKAWKEYNEGLKTCGANQETVSYDDFVYNGLTWKREHINHFALIADSIIGHNIWFGGEKDSQLYKQYGLDELIGLPDRRINFKKTPLLFFLGLMDTIEPIKRFYEDDCRTILASFDMEFCRDKKTIQIRALDPTLKFEEYFSCIEKSSDWLDIEVFRRDSYIDIIIDDGT